MDVGPEAGRGDMPASRRSGYQLELESAKNPFNLFSCRLDAEQPTDILLRKRDSRRTSPGGIDVEDSLENFAAGKFCDQFRRAVDSPGSHLDIRAALEAI